MAIRGPDLTEKAGDGGSAVMRLLVRKCGTVSIVVLIIIDRSVRCLPDCDRHRAASVHPSFSAASSLDSFFSSSWHRNTAGVIWSFSVSPVSVHCSAAAVGMERSPPIHPETCSPAMSAIASRRCGVFIKPVHSTVNDYSLHPELTVRMTVVCVQAFCISRR